MPLTQVREVLERVVKHLGPRLSTFHGKQVQSCPCNYEYVLPEVEFLHHDGCLYVQARDALTALEAEDPVTKAAIELAEGLNPAAFELACVCHVMGGGTCVGCRYRAYRQAIAARGAEKESGNG